MEYKSVIAMFHQTCPGVIVHLLERVQSPKLWAPYESYRSMMPSDSERRLFHGTSHDTVPLIVAGGFNRSFCGKNATVYGEGAYFARDASYSKDYTTPNAAGNRYMFLARVVVGKYTLGKPSFKIPPDGFDSTSNSATLGTLFVVFKDHCAYPEYIISF